MKVYCGTDIIEVDRIQKAIEDMGNNFLNKIYTKNEIQYCESKNKQKYQHYAARFAAKEAIFKAVSNLLKDKNEITWTDAEILNLETGKPTVKFINKQIPNIQNIDISISHIKDIAIAIVVILAN